MFRGIVLFFLSLFLFALMQSCTQKPLAEGAVEETTADASGKDRSVTEGSGEGSPQESPGEQNNSFACGAKLHCTKGATYCEPHAPGICPTTPVPDGGCPVNCRPITCRSQKSCMCISYSCKPLPTGCNDCQCLKKEKGFPGCDCQEKNGGLTLDCPSP